MAPIKQNDILNNFKNGLWILDSLSNLIEQKLQSTTGLPNLKLKELSVLYYGDITVQKIPIFIEYQNIEFSNFLISTLGKGGSLSSFIDDDQKQLLHSLEYLKPLMNGGQEFLKKLSFAKIESSSFLSASSPHLMGIILLTSKVNLSNQNNLLKSIIHELGHQELFLINFLDPLAKSQDLVETKFSPYQKKNRPPIGRLHSLHALYRMIKFNKFFNINSDIELRLFNETSLTLKGDLTPFGENLVLTLEENVCK